MNQEVDGGIPDKELLQGSNLPNCNTYFTAVCWSSRVLGIEQVSYELKI